MRNVMIAAFLKTDYGSFDYPAAIVSLFFVFALVGICFVLGRAIKTGRILFSWTPRTAHTIECWVEREKNPVKFWLMVAFDCVMILVIILLVVGFCFAWFRKSSA